MVPSDHASNLKRVLLIPVIGATSTSLRGSTSSVAGATPEVAPAIV